MMKQISEGAKESSVKISTLPHKKRVAILKTMAKKLLSNQKKLIQANQKDLVYAREKGLSKAMVGRLTLTPQKIRKMAQGILDIARLPDPLQGTLETIRRPNGLLIKKVPVSLGVILIIFESRPNVTADCAALCLKSGNSVILRGGKEAFHSNKAIHQCLVEALRAHGLPQGAFTFVTSRKHEDVDHLLSLSGVIDVVIPRGGESLIRKVASKSRIPVIKHYDGICHTYVDGEAQLAMALDIVENAKVQNPGVCNAMETLLVNQKIAKKFLPPFYERMKEKGVEIRGCSETQKALKGIKKATRKDWVTEYLDNILSVRIVKDMDQAIDHIRHYGSHHSDAIISQNSKKRQKFVREVDSACVFENASTRFADGGEFGMGAEMGISTDKLHARGPVGLRELTSYKYIVSGKGQIRK